MTPLVPNTQTGYHINVYMNQKHVQHECQYLKFISLSLDIVNIDIPVVQTHCEGHWVELGEVQGGNLY